MRLLTYLGLALVLPLALLACGGEEETASGQTIEISGTEFALDPPTVNLDAPGTYTFRFVNNGSTDHALEIEGHGVEEETDVIGGGENAELTVDLSEEGEYEMYCPVDGHREKGMEGTIVVGGAAAGGGTGTEGTTTETTETTDTGEDSGY